MKMGGANRDFFKLSPLGQVAWTVYALETAVYQLDPAEEGWRLLFRMLWSFDQIGHSSYRDTLLLGIIPQDLLETPYCEEEYVDPPRAHCYTKADFLRYSQADWLVLSGSKLTERLPQNEFGYLHPKREQPSFLGITQKTYDQLYTLYRRCPAACQKMADSMLLAVSDVILDVMEGGKGEAEQLWQAVCSHGAETPPAEPFSVYRWGPLEAMRRPLPDPFFLGKPCSRAALVLPHRFV